jgi:phosphatidylglycerol:prolipoprotein diacylglycerol transferase
MLPVLFHVVVPAGLGTPLALALFALIVALRAWGYIRRSRREGERATVGEALRDDGWIIAILALAAGVLWRAGLLGGEIRLPLHTYGLLIASAFMLGIWLSQREGRRRGQDPERIADLSFWILVAALVGSRVYFILVNWGDYFGPGRALVSTPLGRIPRLLAVWEGGLVFYGGFIGAALTAWWYLRRHRMAFLPHADTLIPSVAFGHFLGRLGCFGAGCCWGEVAHGHLPWAARFPPASLAYQTFASRPHPEAFLASDHAAAPPGAALRGVRGARHLPPPRPPRPPAQALPRPGARDVAPPLRGAAHRRGALPRRRRARGGGGARGRAVDVARHPRGGRRDLGACAAAASRRRGGLTRASEAR